MSKIEAPACHWNHPELRGNEFYLGNFTKKSFQDVGYRTRRAGYMAYDSKRKPINDGVLFPVFVDKEEYRDVQEEYSLMGGIVCYA